MGRLYRLTPLWTLLALGYLYLYSSYLYMNPSLINVAALFDFILKFIALPVLLMAPTIAQLMLFKVPITSAKLIRISRFMLAGLLILYGIALMRDVQHLATSGSFIPMPTRFSFDQALSLLAGPVVYTAFPPNLAQKD